MMKNGIREHRVIRTSQIARAHVEKAGLVSGRQKPVDECRRGIGPVDSHPSFLEVVSFVSRSRADFKHRPPRCSLYQLVKKLRDVSIDGLRSASKVGVHIRLVGSDRPLGPIIHPSDCPARKTTNARRCAEHRHVGSAPRRSLESGWATPSAQRGETVDIRVHLRAWTDRHTAAAAVETELRAVIEA